MDLEFMELEGHLVLVFMLSELLDPMRIAVGAGKVDRSVREKLYFLTN